MPTLEEWTAQVAQKYNSIDKLIVFLDFAKRNRLNNTSHNQEEVKSKIQIIQQLIKSFDSGEHLLQYYEENGLTSAQKSANKSLRQASSQIEDQSLVPLPTVSKEQSPQHQGTKRSYSTQLSSKPQSKRLMQFSPPSTRFMQSTYHSSLDTPCVTYQGNCPGWPS